MNVRLYILQRATAAIMAPLVLAHIAVIFYATSRGLSAAEILGRTRGSIGWGLFYGLFVLAAAVHGAIGLRAVASEWTPLKSGQLRCSDVEVRRCAGGAGPARGVGGGAMSPGATTAHRRPSPQCAVDGGHGASALGAGARLLPAAAFLALGLAIEGEARLDGFLKWTASPLVKLGRDRCWCSCWRCTCWAACGCC